MQLLCTGKDNETNFCLLMSRHADGWITLVDLQLDAQNSYLFTYNIFIKILYMF